MLIVLLLLLPALQAFPQFVYIPLSARSAAMGGCLVDDGTTRFVAMGYRSGFATAGLSTARLDAAFPLGQRGRLHAGYSHFGDADYAEHQALAAYSMQIGPRVEVGIAAAYCLQAVADGHYRNRHYLAPAAMARISFTPRLQAMGLVGTRPWDEGRPWRLHVGMAYRAVNRLLTLVEVESEERWCLRMGFEYCYRQHFFFRAGLATAPLVLSAGAGIAYGRYLIDISAESHPVLGLTPQISLAVCF